MGSGGAIRPCVGPALRAYRTSTVSSTTSANLPFLQTQQTAGFSSSTALLRRFRPGVGRPYRDESKHRGESTLRRTGTRWRLSVSDEPLPRPVGKADLPRVETDPEHGLWDFFQDRTTVANAPSKDGQHGRAWSVEELRRKSWDDLHRLWWVCVKERNRIATAELEREASKLGFGAAEGQARDKEVQLTMRAIKHVLTERYYAWEDAVKLAESDPEVNLSGRGTPFTPMEYLEEDDLPETEMTEEDLKAFEEVTEQEIKAENTQVDPSTMPASGTKPVSPQV